MNRITQLLAFLQESPRDNFLIHALALEYGKAGAEEQSQQYFERNMSESPEYIPTYYHYGKLLERVGRTDDAIAIYAKGMELAKAAGDQHAFSELRSVYEELIY